MELSGYDEKIYGLQSGILYGQNTRVDELNTRISSRFSADTPLQPNINVRPSSTKYARFPIIDFVRPFRIEDAQTNRSNPSISASEKGGEILNDNLDKVPLPRTLDYSVGSTFAPIQSNGPVIGFTSNINIESSLRNQYFALQKSPQASFIPSSTSDLYNTTIATPSVIEPQPYPLLFDRYQMNPFASVRNSDPKIGGDKFLNNTRIQLRGGVLA